MRQLSTPGSTTPEPRKNNTYETKLLTPRAPLGATTTSRAVVWRMNETCYSPQVRQHPTVRKQAEQAKTEAREAVELLEQAHELLAKDDAMQPAMEHLHAAIREAEVRAATLEDWYWRTYVTRGNQGT